MYTVSAMNTITCREWCLKENSIYHSGQLYNCFKNLNLCWLYVPQLPISLIKGSGTMPGWKIYSKAPSRISIGPISRESRIMDIRPYLLCSPATVLSLTMPSSCMTSPNQRRRSCRRLLTNCRHLRWSLTSFATVGIHAAASWMLLSKKDFIPLAN